MAPKGNVIATNLCWSGKWANIEKKVEPFLAVTNNLQGVDPKFVDAASHDFRLRKDSPAWKLGFQRVPVKQIGLYRDALRALLPDEDLVSWKADNPK